MSGERILIIDDGKENRDFIMEYVLQPNGFEALAARDGVEGMEMARQYLPDLILLDLQMPRMNGMEVLDALNAEQLNIPVILMTFHGSEEIAIEVYRKGVRDYVKKPYTVEEMYEAIDRSLALVRLRREKDQLTERLLEANAAMHQRVRELNVLYNVGKSMTTLTDLGDLMRTITEAATQLTSSEESYLFLWEKNQILTRAIYRLNDGKAYLLNEPSQESLVQQAIQTLQPVVMTPEEIQQARQYNPSAPSAAMATPLIMSNHPIGALMVRNLSPGARLFTRNDGGLLSALSDYAAMAIANNMGKIATSEPKEREQALRRSVVTQILTAIHEDTDHADGIKRDVSLIGVRLQGHSNFIRKAPPEQIVQALNEYLGIVTKIVFEHQGTVVELTADTVTAVFNAPSRQEDHLQRLLFTSLKIKHVVEQVNKKRGGGLTLGIGLHVGDTVLGYFGIDRTMRYTAVGDQVNIVNHLHTVAKPAQILVTAQLADKVQGFANLQQLGKLPYRGWQDGLLVFELLDMKS